MITFQIDGDPIPWKRPGRNNRTGAIYDQQKLQKEQFRWRVRDKYKGKPITTPVEVRFSFYFPVPKGATPPRRRDMLNGILHHMKRPDVDNLSKFYLDAMTGVVYEDDGQVCKMDVEKLYGVEGCTLIKIIPKTGNEAGQKEVKGLYEDDSGEF